VIHSVDVLRVALALVPVLLFLAALRALDSYKLISVRTVLTALAAGALAALLCFTFNSMIFRQFPGHEDQYARFGAPIVEELAKAVYWIFLIATARAAFMADSAICGFAVGAGFALVENISYLHLLDGRGLGVWVLRGFGTAVMHGGVAALGATLSAYLFESRSWARVLLFAPGVVAAVVLHSSFNQSLQSPVASMVAAVAGLPLILARVAGGQTRQRYRYAQPNWFEGIPADPRRRLSDGSAGKLLADSARRHVISSAADQRTQYARQERSATSGGGPGSRTRSRAG